MEEAIINNLIQEFQADVGDQSQDCIGYGEFGEEALSDYTHDECKYRQKMRTGWTKDPLPRELIPWVLPHAPRQDLFLLFSAFVSMPTSLHLFCMQVSDLFSSYTVDMLFPVWITHDSK